MRPLCSCEAWRCSESESAWRERVHCCVEQPADLPDSCVTTSSWVCTHFFALVPLVILSATRLSFGDCPIRLLCSCPQIGLTYSGWFTYRYLLQAETREELKIILEDLIGKTSR